MSNKSKVLCHANGKYLCVPSVYGPNVCVCMFSVFTRKLALMIHT